MKKLYRIQLLQSTQPGTNPPSGFIEIFADSANNGALTILDSNGIAIPVGSGGSVEYSDTNPGMDGIAAQGTSTKVSRQDHIHPSDTSKAAATHAHGNITSSGNISGAVSGLPVVTGTGGVVQAGAWSAAIPAAATTTGAAGTSVSPARSDHAHPSRVATAAPASPVNGDIWLV